MSKKTEICMMDNLKYSIHDGERVRGDNVEWQAFLQYQRQRLFARLNKYNNSETLKTQLVELGDLSAYQKYKIGTVSMYILESLERMKHGEYGVCKYCGSDIPFERLLIVPAALQCINCDLEHRKE